MLKRVAIIAACALVVGLGLTIASCGFQTDGPAGDRAQPDAPDIEATVQTALRSLESTQPSIVAESADPTPVHAQRAVPASVPTIGTAPPHLPADSTTTPIPRQAAPPTVMPDPSPALPPTVEIVPTADLVRSPEPLPSPTPDGADLRLPAPMFAGTFLDGNEYRLEDTMGSPTLLMFWAPW